MNWQNSLLLFLIMNSLSGSIAYILWKIASVLLSKHKLYTLCNKLFSLMMWFWIIPFVLIIYFIKHFQIFAVLDLWIERVPFKYTITILYIWTIGICLITLCILYAMYNIKYKPIYFDHKNIYKAIKIADATIMNVWLTDKSNEKYFYPGLNYSEPVQVYCTSVPVPMVKVGRVPAIYLPAVDYSNQDLSFVVFHELSHIMRGDLKVRSRVLLIQIIFWFNPLVYLLLNDFERWSETACDIDVCSGRFGNISKKEYLNILLQNTSQWTNNITRRTFANNYFVSHLSPEGKRLKMRISRLLQYNHKDNIGKIKNILGLGYVILTLILILTFAFIFESNILEFVGWL